MKKISKYIIFCLSSIAVTFTACKKDMIDMNTNEELLVSTDPRFVFTSATENWNNRDRTSLMSKYSGVMTLMQYVVRNGGGIEGSYANPSELSNPSPYLPYYEYYYSIYGNRLKYLTEVVIPERVDKDLYEEIGAISKILNTYQAFQVFDTHGAIPYREALQGLNGIITPKYDMYEDVYKELDRVIADQVELLSLDLPNQVNLGNNDFFYKGDKIKWIKFANTVRLKMAQRFEKVDPNHYNSVVESATSHPFGIISNNSESCVYYHNIEHNNDTWDIATLTSQYSASNALVSFLKANNDPRLPLLVRRNGFGAGNNNPSNEELAESLGTHFPDYANSPDYSTYSERYVGIPASPDYNGKPESRDFVPFNTTVDGEAYNFTIRGASQIQSRYFVKNGGNATTAEGERNIDYPRYENNDDMKMFTPVITYAETCFMMAEISEKAEKNIAGKSAEQWYIEGITASMEQYQKWGIDMKVLSAANPEADDYAPITSEAISNYLSQNQIQYTGNKDRKLELIISQAWVNYFMRPEEAYATWKRTGLPKFKSYEAPNPTDGTAFLDEIKLGGTELLIPRRSRLPVPNTANLQNYKEALSKLTAKPEYLEDGKTQGRIFWDIP